MKQYRSSNPFTIFNYFSLFLATSLYIQKGIKNISSSSKRDLRLHQTLQTREQRPSARGPVSFSFISLSKQREREKERSMNNKSNKPKTLYTLVIILE